MNWSTTFPSRIANTAGIDWTRKLAEIAGFSSTLTLASTTAPSVASTTRSRSAEVDRTEGSTRSAPGCPEVDHHRDLHGAPEDLLLEGGIGDVDHRDDDTGTTRLHRPAGPAR